MSKTRCTPSAALLAASLVLPAAWAAPVSISTPFMNMENRNINSLGFATGQAFRIGANSVLPNVNAGTTGLGSTVNLQTGATVTRVINGSSSPLLPNFFERRLSIDPALLGPWTLTFTNGVDKSQAVVSLPAGATVLPFVNSVTLSGTSDKPEFSWTPPPGVRVDGYRLNVYDKSLLGPGNSGQVSSRSVVPGQTSYVVDGADFTVPGYRFTLGRAYSLEISVIQTKDGSNNFNNSNLMSIARSYADFTAREGGGPLVNLPVVLENGAFKFDMAVQAGQTYYIDPEVAVGYDYAIGVGNPNFRSVVLPTGIGDNLFDVFTLDGLGQWMLAADDLMAGQVFDFGAAGVGKFRVLGIEVAAALDPKSTTAFVTGLTFTGNGTFSGTQTPITVNATVPEPPTLALVGLALWGLSSRRSAAPKAATRHQCLRAPQAALPPPLEGV